MTEGASRPAPPPLDLSQVRTIPIAERRNLVERRDFGRAVDPHCGMEEFLGALPRILIGNELREAARRTAASIRDGRLVVLAMGGHVVKTGMAPVIIDLMERGAVHALVMNGATAIHDYEVALIGATSEDVAKNIRDGSFGMARETADAFANAARRHVEGVGLGCALGELVVEGGLPHADVSMLGAARRLGIPVTVHVGVGTDTVHMHPQVDGAALGGASHLDFRVLAELVTKLAGGTWINAGSAVLLPEVFLKVVSLARNLGHPLDGITAINFDMLAHYRTQVNVLQRPVERGISIIGHHEINLPLFRVALLLELEQQTGRSAP